MLLDFFTNSKQVAAFVGLACLPGTPNKSCSIEGVLRYAIHRDRQTIRSDSVGAPKRRAFFSASQRNYSEPEIGRN